MATKKAAVKDAKELKGVKEVKEIKEVKETKATAAPAAEKKAPAKKTAAKSTAKKTAVKENVVVQFAGKEMSTADIMKQVKAYWTKELKKKVSDMKSIDLYVKPEENRAYFVVNGDVTGSVEL